MEQGCIIDISWPITEQMTTYKDKKVVKIVQTRSFEADGVRESIITLGAHSGTHVDAPAHFVKDGAFIDNVALSTFIGRCRVVDVTNVDEKITAEDLIPHNVSRGERILLKTKNSDLPVEGPISYSFVYLERSGAAYLVEKKICLVGIDYLGIERNQPQHPTHIPLLTANIPIVEGLRLKDVSSGEYELCCLPLKITGGDAAPARVVLFKR